MLYMYRDIVRFFKLMFGKGTDDYEQPRTRRRVDDPPFYLSLGHISMAEP